MNSDDDYVDIVKMMMMMKWCLCDNDHEVWWRSNRWCWWFEDDQDCDDNDCEVDDVVVILMKMIKKII